MISIKLCIFLSILATFTIHLTYGIPILKIFNSININNVVNFDNENNNNDNNDNINCNDKNNDNNNDNNKYNNDNKYSNDFDNDNNKLITLEKNYSINAIVIKNIIIYNPLTTYFTGEVILNYNNHFDNHFYCKINVNPPNQTSNTYIQNYIYHAYNLGKLINLTCNYEKCVIYKKRYTLQYKFNYFTCNIKLSKYVNDEF
jgi:hypothetical protein